MIKIANIFTIALLGLIIFAVPVMNALTPDVEISVTERRHMSKFPELTVKKIFDSSTSIDVENYLLDSFFLRDDARKLTASVRYGLMRQLDNSGIVISDGSAAKLEYNFNEKNVISAAAKIDSLYEKYMSDNDCRVFYSIIPDKNCYLDTEKYPGIPYLNYERIMTDNVKNASFIPIFDCLGYNSYYKTDSHWSQDMLGDVVRRLGDKMGFVSVFNEDDYTKVTLTPFYGVNYGQSALPLNPDKLVYLKNSMNENAAVFNFEKDKSGKVYSDEKFNNVDPYDVFLEGACALLIVENPQAASNREIVIFRDSFGSSLTPLLIAEYAKITLVDIRYMSSDLIGEYVTFNDCDVLFIWSTAVLNNSTILR